jgi:hypothetical protein
MPAGTVEASTLLTSRRGLATDAFFPGSPVFSLALPTPTSCKVTLLKSTGTVSSPEKEGPVWAGTVAASTVAESVGLDGVTSANRFLEATGTEAMGKTAAGMESELTG